MTRTVQRMTHAQHYQLCAYLKELPLTEGDTQDTLSLAASATLHFPVNRVQIRECLAVIGKEIPLPPKTPEVALVVIAEALTELYALLGQPIPKKLADLRVR